jgi:uncharacterized protein
MNPSSALIISADDLKNLLAQTAAEAATKAVADLKTELRSCPDARIIQALRQRILRQETIDDGRRQWANSHHICRIMLSAKGKPKSAAWFSQFKRESGLQACFSRSSPRHGRLREWTIDDIASAWRHYYPNT